MAPKIEEKLRARLVEAGQHSIEELTPFSPEEREAVEVAFAQRSPVSGGTKLADLLQEEIDFSNVEFGGFVAKGLIFISDCKFSDATFGWADFQDVTFVDDAHFEDATFADDANFRGATFADDANFRGATFAGWAHFEGATFSDITSFIGATFSRLAHFDDATFFRWTSFDDVTFSDLTSFEGAIFEFVISFVNAEMKSETQFRAVKFSRPPTFFGAKLHEGTVWRDVHWPDPPTDANQAGYFVDAYERLKLEMDRLKKHEDELDFFARELQCRRVMHGDWKAISELRFFGRRVAIPSLKISETIIAPRSWNLFGRSVMLPSFKIPAQTIALHRPAPGLPIALYGLLCDYGRSYVRPLSILSLTVAIGALPLWAHFGVCKFWQAVGLSFANTFGVLGVRKDFFEPNVLTLLPGWLKVAAVVQTGLGVVLLFLFSLALRNRFRMK